MAYNSVLENVQKALSPVMIKLQDLSLTLLGTNAQILRISHTEPDVMGYTIESLETTVITDVLIRYPSDELELFSKTNQTTETMTIHGIDLWEIMPIELFVKYEGAMNVEGSKVEVGDFIVHVFFDLEGNKIPIVMQAKKVYGGFMGRFQIRQKYDLALYRGVLPDTIKTTVDDYLDSITIDG